MAEHFNPRAPTSGTATLWWMANPSSLARIEIELQSGERMRLEVRADASQRGYCLCAEGYLIEKEQLGIFALSLPNPYAWATLPPTQAGSFGTARISNPSTTNQLCCEPQSPRVLTIKARYFPSTRTAHTRSLRPLFLPNGGLFWLSWPTLGPHRLRRPLRAAWSLTQAFGSTRRTGKFVQ
jgi:hypothetical protein